MIDERIREQEREHWRDLVRGLTLVQAGGYPGSVSISKRFRQLSTDDVERLAHMARHIVQEYGLIATVQVKQSAVFLRIEKPAGLESEQIEAVAQSDEAATEDEPSAPSSRRAPIFRLLQLVHLPPRVRP